MSAIKANPEIGDIIGTSQVATNQAILGSSANTITYSADMIVEETMYDETLDMILPVLEEEITDETVIAESEADATADFVTGQDDMDMRQDDINAIAA